MENVEGLESCEAPISRRHRAFRVLQARQTVTAWVAILTIVGSVFAVAAPTAGYLVWFGRNIPTRDDIKQITDKVEASIQKLADQTTTSFKESTDFNARTYRTRAEAEATLKALETGLCDIKSSQKQIIDFMLQQKGHQ